jgi:hypothetical protein
MLSAAVTLPSCFRERATLFKHRSAEFYCSKSSYIALLLSDAPLSILEAILLSVISYFWVGMRVSLLGSSERHNIYYRIFVYIVLPFGIFCPLIPTFFFLFNPISVMIVRRMVLASSFISLEWYVHPQII